MVRNNRQEEARLDAALAALGELLRQGRVTRSSALVCPTLLRLVRDGRAEGADDADAAAVAAVVVADAIQGLPDSEAAGVLFGLTPSTEGRSLGARRAAASQLIGVSPQALRKQREPHLLGVLADALLAALPAMEKPMRISPSFAIEPTYFLPLRPVSAQESNRLADARRAGAFVAWRDGSRALRVHSLRPGKPLTVGRSIDNAVAFDHLLVSRDHAEVLLRVRSKPTDMSVFLLDLRSKHGTAVRPLQLNKGAERPSGPLQPAPSQPAGPLRLKPGDHDVNLAGEVWLRIGGVPVDRGATQERGVDLPGPTPRERDVLVELCRPQFAAGRPVGTPSNAKIGLLVTPPIGAERVSDLLSQMYLKYDLTGTKEHNRLKLVEFALEHRLVGPDDYA